MEKSLDFSGSQWANEEEFLSGASPDVLAAQVVIYKALGLRRQLAIKCMEELMKRKLAGNDFDYDSFVEKELAAFPKPTDQKIISSMVKMDFRQ